MMWRMWISEVFERGHVCALVKLTWAEDYGLDSEPEPRSGCSGVEVRQPPSRVNAQASDPPHHSHLKQRTREKNTMKPTPSSPWFWWWPKSASPPISQSVPQPETMETMKNHSSYTLESSHGTLIHRPGPPKYPECSISPAFSSYPYSVCLTC